NPAFTKASSTESIHGNPYISRTQSTESDLDSSTDGYFSVSPLELQTKNFNLNHLLRLASLEYSGRSNLQNTALATKEKQNTVAAGLSKLYNTTLSAAAANTLTCLP